MAWVKGQSGNPGGRPKMEIKVRALLDDYTPEAINTLANIMRDPKVQPSARVAAATALLRKVVPDQASVDHTTDGQPITGVRLWTREEWLQSLTTNGNNSGDSMPEHRDTQSASVTDEPVRH